MTLRMLVLPLLLVAVPLEGGAALAAKAAPAAHHGKQARDARALRDIRDWALLRCLGHTSSSEAMKQDYFASAAAILERSKVYVETFEQADAVAKNYAKRTYGGSVPSDYNGLKCVDLYHSAELGDVIKHPQ